MAESGHFTGQFTATRAMKANDPQECKVIEFQRFLTRKHSVWLILKTLFEGRFWRKNKQNRQFWPEIDRTQAGMQGKF
jgi:hypothetical protein